MLTCEKNGRFFQGDSVEDHRQHTVTDEVVFASVMADNAAVFCQGLAAYLARHLGMPMRVLHGVPWQERERMLYRGQAQLGVVCGLQYVYAVDRGEQPGIDVLAAPVMRGARYQGRPIYFSDVVVVRDDPARCLSDLRGAAWAYNEPTSHSGYILPRYVWPRAAIILRVSSGASRCLEATSARWS